MTPIMLADIKWGFVLVFAACIAILLVVPLILLRAAYLSATGEQSQMKRRHAIMLVVWLLVVWALADLYFELAI